MGHPMENLIRIDDFRVTPIYPSYGHGMPYIHSLYDQYDLQDLHVKHVAVQVIARSWALPFTNWGISWAWHMSKHGRMLRNISPYIGTTSTPGGSHLKG